FQPAQDHLERPAPGGLEPVFHRSQRGPVFLLVRFTFDDPVARILESGRPMEVKV
ncbi:MAG: hypothetical protein ACJA1W_002882, partial [Akkermansiaceae bacterium]